MMTYQETCSCGASIQIPSDDAVYRWAEQHVRFLNTVQDWRQNHRHELLPGERLRNEGLANYIDACPLSCECEGGEE